MSNSETSVHPRKVLFPLGLGTALSLMGDGTLYTVLPTHTAEAGIALTSVGIILGVNRAVRLLFNGPAGLAYDRCPRRRLFVPALFIGALSTAVYAATRGFWPLLFGRLLWGLAWSGIWVGGATVILDLTTTQDRGRWMGLYQTWYFLGAVLSAFAGGLLTDWLGYSTTMWVSAAVTALGGMVALILLPETRSVHPELDNPSVEEIAPRLRTNWGLWIAAALQGINRFVGAGVLAATMGLLVQDRLQSASLALGVATLTGAINAGKILLSVVAAPLAGTVSDRLGSRWGVTTWGLAIGIISMTLVAQDAPHRRRGKPGTTGTGHRSAAHGWRSWQRSRAAGRLCFNAVDWAEGSVSALRGGVGGRVAADGAVSATRLRRYVIRPFGKKSMRFE
jgi:MFS family permease